MLSDLIASGCLPYEKRGNRTVADFDTVMMCLNQMLGLEATNAIPHVRTIRGATRDIKNNNSDLGIGEEQIRAAVDDERIDFIRIGNRAYIALELFEEPYIQHFTQIRFDRTERIRFKVVDLNGRNGCFFRMDRQCGNPHTTNQHTQRKQRRKKSLG